MRLKELREEKGVTQKNVAEEIGCSANTYARYENEKRQPDIQTLKALSKYFEVTIDYIVCNNWRRK